MQPAPAPGKRVLVIDDEESLRDLLQLALREGGYAVETARDGLDGLEQLKSKKFDLVLLDVWMPRMNGLQMLTELQQLPAPPRVIMMTADHTPETLLHTIRESAYQYIGKPFTLESMMELVGKAITCPEQAAIEVLSAKPEWVELLVPCQKEAVDRIESFLMAMKGDLAEEVRYSVGQAFHELLLNAIEWGGKLDPNRKVHIAYLRTKRMILYRIADPGTGFRFQDLTHAAVSNQAGDSLQHVRVRDEKGMRPGGFGILLTRSLVDELIYNQQQNEVMFVKYLQ